MNDTVPDNFCLLIEEPSCSYTHLSALHFARSESVWPALCPETIEVIHILHLQVIHIW